MGSNPTGFSSGQSLAGDWVVYPIGAARHFRHMPRNRGVRLGPIGLETQHEPDTR